MRGEAALCTIGLSKADQAFAVSLAEALIRCNSANPPGGEREAALLLAEPLRRAGFAVQLDEFEPNRCNLTATLGDPDHIGLLLQGHLDVVPAGDGWSRPPFVPAIENGRLYGRGSCDMKSGIAAMTAAALALARSGATLQKGLRLVFVADEEHENRGVKHWLDQNSPLAEAAVIGEPTGVQPQLGNKGYASYFVRTRGVSCHASRPERGVNAIYKMARAVLLLEEHAQAVARHMDPHLGGAALSVGTIHGGEKINTVPDACVCEVERRVLPGETYEALGAELQSLLGDLAEVCPRGNFLPASLLDPHDPLVQDACGCIRAACGREPEIGVFTAGTEAAYFSQRGIPTLILGPGHLDQAHTVDEFAAVSEIMSCADVYYRLLCKRHL